jgi:hypothetical protein
MKDKLRFFPAVGVVAGSLVGSTSVFVQQQGQQLTGDPTDGGHWVNDSAGQ